MNAEYCMKKLFEYSSNLNNCCAFVQECAYTGKCHFGDNLIAGCTEHFVFRNVLKILEKNEMEDINELKRQLDKLYEELKALRRQVPKWIPVSEDLPPEEEVVLVSCKSKRGVRSVNRAYHYDGFWHGSGSMAGVEAWMTLPEPYEEKDV